METKNQELIEKLVNIYVNHESYKQGDETAIKTLNRYRWALYDLGMLPEEVSKEVTRRVAELRERK